MGRYKQGEKRRQGRGPVKMQKGHGLEHGERSLKLRRRSSRRMMLKMNIGTCAEDDGKCNHMQVRFDYDFADTELLDQIEDNVAEGIAAMDLDGEVTSDEALDFLQNVLNQMAAGIAATRAQVEEG